VNIRVQTRKGISQGRGLARGWSENGIGTETRIKNATEQDKVLEFIQSGILDDQEG
jgi:hypothetical protein